MALPVLLPGHDRPRAILVAGVSPMRALDADYGTFFSLIARDRDRRSGALAVARAGDRQGKATLQ